MVLKATASVYIHRYRFRVMGTITDEMIDFKLS